MHVHTLPRPLRLQALCLACFDGNSFAVTRLLNAGADVTADIDRSGDLSLQGLPWSCTPLNCAVCSGVGRVSIHALHLTGLAPAASRICRTVRRRQST